MTDRISKIILRGDISGLKSSMTAASASVADVTKRMTASNKEAATWRQGMTAVGDSAMKMGIVVSAGLLLAGKAAVDWESAWAGVTKTVDGSVSEMAELETGLRNLAKSLPATHSEIAAVAEAAGQLGVAREDIVGFTKTMIDLSETTNLTADEAATSIAQLRNIMGDSPDDVDNLGAALVALGNDGASTERDIVQMAQRIAGAGKTVGLATSDVLGISNAVASMGIDVEAGGTAVSTVLSRMAMAASSGGDKLDAFASVARVSAEDFATAFKERPAEALVMFTKGLEQTQKAGGDLYGQLKEVGLSDVRVSQALIGMASSGDLLTNSLTLGAEAWKANTALSAEAEKRYGTTAAQVQVAWNEMKDAAIDAGASLLPVAKTMASAVSSVASAFGGLSSPVQSGLTAVGGIAAVSLLVVGATSKMIQSVAATRLAMTQLGLTASSTGAALGLLAKGGAGLAAFWAGAAVGDKVGERNSKAIDKLAKSLERLGKTGKATGDLEKVFGGDLGGKSIRLGKDLGSIGDALKSLDGYADDNALTETLKFFGSAGQSAGITEQAEALMDMDKAFSSLAKNKPDAAIAAFGEIRDRAIETGASTEDVARAFPEMTSLLQSASQSMGGTSDASEILAGNLNDLAPAAQQSAEEIKAAQEALDAARESAMATSLSFFDFSRDAKQSFGDYLDQLEKSADAYANFTDNAIKASANGLDGGLIDQLKEQGPEGALALADFADASEKEIKRANRAFRDTTGLSELQAELDLLPDDIVTNFKTAGAPDAIQTAADVAHEYKMSPELVETILKAKDYTKADIKAVLTRLAELDATSANPTVGVTGADAAIDKISALRSSLSEMARNYSASVSVGVMAPKATKDADGSIHTPHGRVTHFANGGMREDHVAQIAPAGAWRVWAEEETGGEAYIPLSAAKRPRSRSIAEQTVGILGGSVEWYANGGINSRYDDYSALTKSSKLDLAQQQQRIKNIEKSLDEKETYGKGKNKKKRLALRGLDRTVAQLELKEAKAELKRMVAENKKLKGYGTKEQEEARRDAEEERKDTEEKAVQAAEDIVKEAADRFTSAKTSAAQRFTIGSATSAAAVDRNLKRLLVDASTFLGLLGDLKAKGASPWLLAQLVEAGPTPGAIRLAREYNTNQAALDAVNATGAQIDQYTNAYAGLVGNAAFLQPAAWNSGVSSASQASFTASIVGAEVSVGSDGLMRFVKGQIVVAQDAQALEGRYA